MKSICYDAKRVNEWVSQRIGRLSPWQSEYQAIGIEKDGCLVGGVVVNGIVIGARCSIHCAGEGKFWLNREFLRVVFHYVFNTLNCNVVINPVDADNADSIRFTSHLGFKESLRIPNGSKDCDLLIFTMPRASCRWVAQE